MKRIKKLISSVVLMMMLIAPIITVAVVPQEARADGEVLISVVPKKEKDGEIIVIDKIAPGESFTVDIEIDPQGINNIAGVQTNFEFDKDLVEVNDLIWGDLIDPSFSFYMGIDNTLGIINSINGLPEIFFPIDTSFVLATVNFTAKVSVSGTSYLRLPNTGYLDPFNSLIILDYFPEALPYIVADSSLIISDDFTSPAISSVATAHADGSFKEGEIIDITVAYDKVVDVVTTGGTPALALNSGGSAVYNSGTGTDTLTFEYTVTAEENSADLDYIATDSLVLNSGTIKDVALNIADNTLPAVGTFAAAHAIVIDTVLPVISSYALNGQPESVSFNPNLGDEIEIAINASEEVDWTSIKIENVDDSGIYKIWQPGADCDGSSQCTKSWDGSLSGGTLVDDEYKIKVKIKDAAGNENIVEFTDYTITVDTIAPTIELLNIPSNPTSQTTADITVSGDDIVFYKYKLDGANYGEEIAIDTNIVLSGLSEGDHTIVVKGRDASGNWSGEISETWTIDLTAPSSPVVTDPAEAIILNAGKYSITGTAEENSLVEIYSGTELVGSQQLGIGETDYLIEVNLTQNADNNFTAIATDLAGNKSVSAIVPAITEDSIAPVITLLGNNPVNIYAYAGTIYADTGATALDDVDGNITNNIAVVNPVDTAVTGTYTVTYNVLDSVGNSAQEITRTVNILPVEQDQALIEKNMTVSSSVSEILIGDNAPSSAIINVPLEVTNARINVSALMSGDSEKSAVIPSGLTINSSTGAGEVNVQIPQGIRISGNSSWTGEINLPQAQENTSVNIASDPGYNSEISSVIEIGFGDILLNFNKAVRIKIAGQAGKYAGYARDGVFTQITDICGADSQAAGDALSEGAECKIDIGSDLIIWTKHFTKFAAYTQTAIAAPAGGGGIIIYNYSAAIDYQRSAEKIVGAPAKEKIIVKNTGTGRLNPGTLTMTLSPEYFALNLANPVWKSYNSDTGTVVWETPALDYAKEYFLEMELLPLKAGKDIITSLVYHTINTEVSASAAETIKPAVEKETPLDAAPKEESLKADIPAGETTGGNETTGTAAESSSLPPEGTVSPESPGTASFSAETGEGRVAGERSDDTMEENPPSSLLQSGNESEEIEVRGAEADEEILTEEKDKEGEDKNVKEIIQGVISGYWWLGALMIILGLSGYYYLGKRREEKK